MAATGTPETLVVQVNHYRITFIEKAVQGECDVTAEDTHDDTMKWKTCLAAGFWASIHPGLTLTKGSTMNLDIEEKSMIVHLGAITVFRLNCVPPKTFCKQIETEMFLIEFSLTPDTFIVKACEKPEPVVMKECSRIWRWEYLRVRSVTDYSTLTTWVHSSKVWVMQKNNDILQVFLPNYATFELKPVEKSILPFVQFDCSSYIVELDRRDQRTITVTVRTKQSDLKIFQCVRKQHPLHVQLFQVGAKVPTVGWLSISSYSVTFDDVQTFECNEILVPRESLLTISHREETDKYVIEIELTDDTLSTTITERNNKDNVWIGERIRQGGDWRSLNSYRDRRNHRANIDRSGNDMYVNMWNNLFSS